MTCPPETPWFVFVLAGMGSVQIGVWIMQFYFLFRRRRAGH